ncbi:MAG: hypothetical protein CMG13_04155 [Candidatus Marinimicrobia bacterium]|nr:hypothetical protein [Candidatus Neomarinimicrobiota bacterium]
MYLIYIIILIISSTSFADMLNFNYSKKEYLINEMKSIKESQINQGLHLFPSVDYLNEDYVSILKNDGGLKIYPIFAIRYSSAAFEMFEDYVGSDLMWISPGLEFEYNKPIVMGFFDLGISIQAWSRFYKHSAYGFNGDVINNQLSMFNYNPDYSFEFYTSNFVKPEHGVEFDQGEGAVALVSPWIDVIFGKFKSSVGPSFSGNLSLSGQSPNFAQMQTRFKLSKMDFTIVVGELYSNLFENINYSDQYDFQNSPDIDQENGLVKKVNRYIVNHRLDYYIRDNLRIGFYEQVIVGHNLSFSYMIPTVPFWSAQHSLGDTDNLQLGFDIDYIGNKNRLYMALIMDEWDPYNTFESENHHNWFGGQLGFSRLISENSILKAEYTKIQPQVYTHDHPINLPYHHDYPVGFWSKGDSEEIFLNYFFKLSELKDLSITARHTIMGSPRYDENTDFLDSNDLNPLKKRFAIGVRFCSVIDSKLGPFKYVMNLNRIDSNNLYNDEQFLDCQISLLYNINY